jgi:hypothetical protein
LISFHDNDGHFHEDRLFPPSKKTDQNRNDIETGKKTQYNCNRHSPIFPPGGFELMSNSSPKRFFAPGMFQQNVNPADWKGIAIGDWK